MHLGDKGRSARVQGQPGLYKKSLYQIKQKTKLKKHIKKAVQGGHHFGVLCDFVVFSVGQRRGVEDGEGWVRVDPRPEVFLIPLSYLQSHIVLFRWAETEN